MIFVGYSDIHKAYKCFDETRLLEVYSPHVTFDERISTSSVEYPSTFAEHVAPIERPEPVQSSSRHQEPIFSQTNPEVVTNDDMQSEEDIVLSPKTGVDTSLTPKLKRMTLIH